MRPSSFIGRILYAAIVGIIVFGVLEIIALLLDSSKPDISHVISVGAPILGLLIGLWVFFTNKQVS